MADTIKIGNLEIDNLKVGTLSVDALYIGDVKIYPSTPTPTPTLHWVSYSEGDAIPTEKSFYGVKLYQLGEEESSIEFGDAGEHYGVGFAWGDGDWYAIDFQTGDQIDITSFYDYDETCYIIPFSEIGFGGLPIYYPSDYFLFDTELYEEETPTPQTLQWVTFNTGDTIPSTLDIYGIKFSDAEMAMNTLGNSSQPFYIEPYRRVFDIYIGGKYYDQISTSFEVVFSEIDSSYTGDYLNFNSDIVVYQSSCPIQLLIYQ